MITTTDTLTDEQINVFRSKSERCRVKINRFVHVGTASIGLA